MSDHWIAIIPRDINSPVERNALQQVADMLSKLAPDADEIEIVLGKSVKMFDCGANLHSVKCPSCGAELGEDWWADRAEEGYNEDDDIFQLSPLDLPCCRYRCTLNDLHFDFDQGFAHWGVDVMNPSVGKLDDGAVKEFEELLGCRVKVVYQHV